MNVVLLQLFHSLKKQDDFSFESVEKKKTHSTQAEQ